MGTYMSAFIEIDYSKKLPSFHNSEQIYSLTEGSFVFGKDYEVFDALAYGRQGCAEDEDRDLTQLPKFEPRGIPVPQSLTVARNFFLLVVDPRELPDCDFWPQHRCIITKEADDLVRLKGCMQSEVTQWFNTGSPDDIIWRVVAEPHFYNASWLWPHEYNEALSYHGLVLDSLPVEYSILKNAMELLEGKHGHQRVRLVIWFS
jgi:hypothetical protein